MKTVDTDKKLIHNANLEAQYSADDFVNQYDASEKAFVILDGGVVQAIVFSEYQGYSEQDALDEAVDSGKLDHFQVSASELVDYVTGQDGEGNPEYEGLSFLGNACEPFDIQALDIWILPASEFAEEPALMTTERVMSRLEEKLEVLEGIYKLASTSDAHWSDCYAAVKNAEDAITLFRLMCLNRK